MNDSTNGTLLICCVDRYGWNIYTNIPNLHIMEDVIKNDIKKII